MNPISFPPLRALVFDMDGTLYRNSRLDRRYLASMHAALAESRGVSLQAAAAAFQEKFSQLTHALGYAPSQLYTLRQLGVSDQSWAKRHGCRVKPETLLKPNPRLQHVLSSLRQRFRLAVVTNNHRCNTRSTLDRMGIEGCFDEILTLTESRRMKPDAGLYAEIARRLQVAPAECLSVGDRYDLDLAPAAEIGMHTFLIQNLQDVYRLPACLRTYTPRLIRAAHPAAAQQAAGEAARVLRAGGLAVLPTDTVYGLVCSPEEKNVRWIFRAKNRPPDQPLIFLLADPREAEKYARLTAKSRELMARHWPGALTLVLPARPGTPWGKIARSGRTLGLRVPRNDLCRRIIRLSGGVLASTSANRSGRSAPVHAHQLDPAMLAFCELVVDGGPAAAGVASTVARVSGRKIQIIRPGSISLAT